MGFYIFLSFAKSVGNDCYYFLKDRIEKNKEAKQSKIGWDVFREA